jgi:hypothetical protein
MFDGRKNSAFLSREFRTQLRLKIDLRRVVDRRVSKKLLRDEFRRSTGITKEERKEYAEVVIRSTIPLIEMKNRKRKRTEDTEEPGEENHVSLREKDASSDAQQTSEIAPPEPINFSVKTLTAINSAFTASTLSQQPLLEGRSHSHYVPLPQN